LPFALGVCWTFYDSPASAHVNETEQDTLRRQEKAAKTIATSRFANSR